MCKNSFQPALYSSFTQDIFKQATEDRLTSAKELPYFEGDFWPNVLEESIKELEQEEEERKREENNTSNESTDVSGAERWLHFLDCCCHKTLIILFATTSNMYRQQMETAKMPKRRIIKRQARTRVD